ncbi:MAG TPA: alkaline phosphatase family protein [Rhodocyclaceae bacterium]|nr:alkaline phosphatase family protein [Rhodocyclaceae bacterium]
MKSLSAIACALLTTLSVNSAAQRLKVDGVERVLMISVDGLHALDLRDFSARHPHSTLAELAKTGITYTQAHTVSPADSFPGLLALTTGGTPAVTGVYYDESYDRHLSPPGSHCRDIGTPVIYDESVDGDGAESGQPALNARLLPLDPKGCKPVYPHDYLRVNTVFEIIRQAGGHTAWIDKHPVYEILNGPSGRGVEDLYTPEIGANYQGRKGRHGDKITASVESTERYDQAKVGALINEIHGFRHDGKTPAPVPTLFGLNLQAVNVGQKLAGYRNAQGHPTQPLEAALLRSDALIGKIVAALRERQLLDSTLLIVTAKHGNGPIDPQALRHVDRKEITKAVERAAPGALAQITSDQGALIWLRDPSKAALVAHALEHHARRLGIRRVLYGPRLALRFPSPMDDPRTPDLILIPARGVIYAKAGDRKKAEHGGFVSDDTHVALLISNPHLHAGGAVNRSPVFTTQVAPTLLASLGLSPSTLAAVKKQGTPVLPGEDWKSLAVNPDHQTRP